LSKYLGVIFDLDGTLADTLGDIALSMNSALLFCGFPTLPEADYASLVGRGIRRLAEDCLPPEARNPETVEILSRKAAELYAEKPLATTKPYPGIVELLYGLRTLKIKTAVLSNKPDLLTKSIIDGLFAPSFFDIVQGEIPGVPRKPDPASTWEILFSLGVTPRQTIFAGDSEIDMETARASECSALGVSWGYRGREALQKAGASRIIDFPEELLGLIQETRY
jgi:phosphoglycolate phosphatase